MADALNSDLHIDVCLLLGLEDLASPLNATAPAARWPLPPRVYSRGACAKAVAALPTSLEHIRLSSCKTSVTAFLDELMPIHQPSPLPNLKMITVTLVFGSQIQLDGSQWRVLMGRAEWHGISLERIPF